MVGTLVVGGVVVAAAMLRTLEQEQLLGRLHMLQQEFPLLRLAPPHTVSLFMLSRELAKLSLLRAPEP